MGQESENRADFPLKSPSRLLHLLQVITSQRTRNIYSFPRPILGWKNSAVPFHRLEPPHSEQPIMIFLATFHWLSFCINDCNNNMLPIKCATKTALLLSACDFSVLMGMSHSHRAGQLHRAGQNGPWSVFTQFLLLGDFVLVTIIKLWYFIKCKRSPKGWHVLLF